MMTLLTTVFAPIGRLWLLAESRILLSIAILAVVAAVTAGLGMPAVAMAVVAILALLLMRADGVLAAQRAARVA